MAAPPPPAIAPASAPFLPPSIPPSTAPAAVLPPISMACFFPLRSAAVTKALVALIPARATIITTMITFLITIPSAQYRGRREEKVSTPPLTFVHLRVDAGGKALAPQARDQVGRGDFGHARPR